MPPQQQALSVACNFMRKLSTIVLFALTAFASCRVMSDGTLKPRYVRKWYKEKLPYEFKTSNTNIPYLIDKDSLLDYKVHGVSFCTQLEKEFTKAQEFYEKQFSFKNEEPLEKKSFYCGLDTCLLRNTNTNCQFTLYYLSRETEIVNRKKGKPLEQLLIKSDTFYSEEPTRNYVISIRLQIDLNFSLDVQTKEPTCSANYSSTFYIKKNSDADKSDWNPILPEHTNNVNYDAFINAYHTELSKACDMETFKFKMVKGRLNSGK
jgi:hypothetical protein